MNRIIRQGKIAVGESFPCKCKNGVMKHVHWSSSHNAYMVTCKNCKQRTCITVTGNMADLCSSAKRNGGLH